MTEWAERPPAIYRRPDDVRGLQANWAIAQLAASFVCTGYKDYAAPATSSGADRNRIAVVKTASGSDLMLPFVVDKHHHSFSVGERRLGLLSVRSLQLVNPWLAEGHQPHDIARLLSGVLATERVDLINLGEILQDSSLRAALDKLSWKSRKLRIERKNGVRWLIDLPDSMKTYLHSLPRKDRKNLDWKMRKASKNFDVRLETFTDPSNLERFLEEGERISRLTYQWNVGQQLRNDRETLDRYRMLAEQGRLRCYLLLLDGVPRAFSRGVAYGDIFHEETPGYDPDFAKFSIGTIMLLRVLQDLIENSTCTVYDFGSGGDWSGFKSRFGNRALVCNTYYVINATRPRGLMLLAGQNLLTSLKNLAAVLIPDGTLREVIKRRMRKYGD